MVLRFTIAMPILLLFFAGALPAQTVFWPATAQDSMNSQFDGGLNDWTTEGVASADPDSAQNAVWLWDAEGDAVEGAFWGTRTPIESPSVANGAAVFNSDFLDNGGDGAVLGDGPAPAPQVSLLTSPSIDCSGQANVALVFNQYFRNFQATTYIEVSVNGGNNWTRFDLPDNDAVPLNVGTINGSVRTVVLSPLVDNEPDVRIRFVFDGNYYFWIVDDVRLVSFPEAIADLRINNFRFFPPESAFTPRIMAPCDTMGWSVGIQNATSIDQDDVWVGITVYDPDTNAVFADSALYGLLPANSADTVGSELLDDLWAIPEGVRTGEYLFEYRVWSPGTTDILPGNNNRQTDYSFNVTTDLWAKEDVAGIPPNGSQPADGGDFIVVNTYTSCNWNTADSVMVKDVEYSLRLLPADTNLNGRAVTLGLFELLDPTLDSGIDPFAGNDDLLLLASNQRAFTENDLEGRLYSDSLINLIDFTPGVYIEPNTTYFVATDFRGAANNVMFHATDDTRFHFNPQYLIWTDGNWIRFIGDDNLAYVLRIPELLIITNSREVAGIPEESLRLLSNPASDFVRAQVNLEKPTDVTFFLADINGTIKRIDNYSGVQQATFDFDVSQYPAGTYLMKLSTPEGFVWKKFVVVH